MDGVAVSKNLVKVPMVMDGNSMVLAIEFVSKWYPFFMEPCICLAGVKDDNILEGAESDVHQNVTISSEKVETGIIDVRTTSRGEIELGGTEYDYLVDFNRIGKVDGLVDVDKIKASHGEFCIKGNK